MQPQYLTVAMAGIGCLVSGLAVGAFVGELVSATTVLDCVTWAVWLSADILPGSGGI